jgi:TonB family protein
MTMIPRRLPIAALLVVTAVPWAAAQDLTAARDLYAAAAYEDALLVLNRIRAAGVRPDESPVVEQYRAFCLLALGREEDAHSAIEAIVAANPSYHPAGEDISPRLLAAFREVRQRVLPEVVQQTYTRAKDDYDRKAFAAAATGFKQVLQVLADPDLAAQAHQPPLSDLRVLAAGFHDLAATAAAPPPPPPPPPPAPEPEPQPAPTPAVPRIYGPEDPQVTPPVVVKQSLPSFPTNLPVVGQGIIEVVIDETGRVEQAEMRAPLHPSYDRLATNAAKEWRYKPATLKGQPVKYRKAIQISVKR